MRRDETEYIPPPPAGFPALASHINVIWNEVHFINGELDWSAIETQVAQIAAQHVTLANGTAIPRPVWLTLPVFWRQGEPGKCEYSGRGNVLIVPTPLAPVGQVVPAFGDAGFLTRYRDFVLAAGRQWNNDPRIAGVIIAGGYDNETQIGASYCNVLGERNDFPVTKQQMTDFVTNAIEAFHDAFPDKPVYLNFAPAPTDQARCDWVNLMLSYNPRHIGVGFNGMKPDVPAFVEHPPVLTTTPTPSGLDCGPLELIKRYAEILPVKFEPVTGFPSGNNSELQWRYWSWLLALTARVDFVDVQDAWFCSPVHNHNGLCFPPTSTPYTPPTLTLNAVQTPNPATGDDGFPVLFSDWIERQLGKTAATNDQLWVVLRETEYPIGTPKPTEPIPTATVTAAAGPATSSITSRSSRHRLRRFTSAPSAGSPPLLLILCPATLPACRSQSRPSTRATPSRCSPRCWDSMWWTRSTPGAN
ncbi:MAG: hypothetical protein IPO15_04415 [Anaerolineae bacterium]|uniref:hypothetical protein n=1 Tax=Candidatus Amarolinea dominans TaxID=3140696 RepID=UPI003136519B|nr:hypothetical protein [Anaerolineae bacterium]